ncbi:GLPGLI family protein [Lewinella sp. IMCC34183]|uniref:GLPGLI family protein n=1 Tax=Lewinella sp. IMCC34183 TaxID=2248762 RepID=UPI0013004329|nr:GLPGLI family protein [Lewinella sp. IMCC34183]
MKHLPHYLILLQLCLFSSSSSGQTNHGIEGTVIYRWHSDTAMMDSIFRQLQDKNPADFAMVGANLQRSEQIIRQLTFELLFTPTEAVWQIVEDAMAASEDAAGPYMMVKMRAGGNRIHYVNVTEKERLYEIKFGQSGGVVHVTTPYDKFTWQLTGRSKQVGKYTCREAKVEYVEGTGTNGKPITRSYIAWFTPQLPYPYGPAGIDGLPGLILELYFDERAITGYRAESIDIEQVAHPSLPALQKPMQVMTEDEINQAAGTRMRRMSDN